MKEKTVQIPESLYKLLVQVHLRGEITEISLEEIQAGLAQKEESRKRRCVYQAMHDTSLDAEERAVAKEIYQDLIGVPRDFRY